MKTGVFADGGEGMGLGHLSRCLGLAQAIQRCYGHRPIFITSHKGCKDWVHRHGFLSEPLRNRKWDWVILDSYRVTRAQIEIMRRSAHELVYIDDLGRTDIPCDWILNSSIYAHKIPYAKSGGRGLLLGPKFQPLRKEFWNSVSPHPIRSDVRHILVTLGGWADPKLTKSIVNVIRKALPQPILHMVSGPVNKTVPEEGGERIVVHRSPRSLKEPAKLCDLAVSGGGQTLYEFARIGLPGVTIPLAANQSDNVKGFEAAGVFVSAGSPEKRDFHDRLKECLRHLGRNVKLRKRMSEAGQSLIDGKGAERAVHAWMGVN